MNVIRFFMTVCLIALVAACGYHFEGGGYINEDVTRVAVDVFENKSSETRAGMSFTNQLIREIQQKTDTLVVDSAKATRKIVGTVNAITFSALARVNTATVVERKVTALVDVQLLGPDGEILWSVKNLSAKESYTVEVDKVDDEANKREAVEKIALRSSEMIVSQMMTNF
jgi:outer membrane lipopolysaccharide assembly protein LptE/RlpB